jgi:hypothetical protein
MDNAGESMSHPRSASPSPSSMSDTFVVEPELLDPVMKPEGPRIKGYALYSDEECDPGDEGKGFIDFGSQLDNIVKESGLDMVITQFAEDDVVTHQVGGGFGWLFPSLLPQYTADQISVTSTMSVAESALDTITMYRELREASLDSQFEAILVRLQSEWAYVGASVCESSSSHINLIIELASLARSPGRVRTSTWSLFFHADREHVDLTRRSLGLHPVLYLASMALLKTPSPWAASRLV